MKIIKNSMRVWITIASLFSFLVGWVFFAHSNKPAPLQFNQPALTSPTSNRSGQLFSRSSQSAGFPFLGQSQSTFSRPRLRTGGS